MSRGAAHEFFPEMAESAENARRVTALAHANIALIKYWGNMPGNLPHSDTISFNLSACYTTTTCALLPELDHDVVWLNNRQLLPGDKEYGRTVKHLDLVRDMAGDHRATLVVSYNSFPTSTGIASSASGFAALSAAAAESFGLPLSQRELSILARQGSGSAARSVPGGFVQWHKGEDSNSSYAETIYPPNYWNLMDFVVVLETGEKKVGSADGHKIAHTSPFFSQRLQALPGRIDRIREGLKRRDIVLLGEAMEEEAQSLHLVAETSVPPINYRSKATLHLCDWILPQWRAEGIPAYFTLDAGPNVHIIVPGEYKGHLWRKLIHLQENPIHEIDLKVQQIIANEPSEGVSLTNDHLF